MYIYVYVYFVLNMVRCKHDDFLTSSGVTHLNFSRNYGQTIKF